MSQPRYHWWTSINSGDGQAHVRRCRGARALCGEYLGPYACLLVARPGPLKCARCAQLRSVALAAMGEGRP